jgi:hypothetical protein
MAQFGDFSQDTFAPNGEKKFENGFLSGCVFAILYFTLPADGRVSLAGPA